MSTMTFPTVESAAAAVDGDIAIIERAINGIRSTAADRSRRYANASQCWSALAREVARYLSDPDGVGTDALRVAYEAFMGRHAGNFADLLTEHG